MRSYANRTATATAAVENRSNRPQLDRRPWAVRVRERCTELGLHPTTRLLGLTVATYFDKRGTWAMPICELEVATGLKRAAVFRHLARLRTEGVIEVDSGGGKRRSRYRIGAALCDGGRAAPVHDGGPLPSTTVDPYVSGTSPKIYDPKGDLSTVGTAGARVRKPKSPPVETLATERQIRRYVVARDQGLPRDEWLPDWHRPEELRSWTRRAVSELITRVETREATLKAGMARVGRHIAQERCDLEARLDAIKLPPALVAKFDPQPEPITARIPTCLRCRQTNPTSARRGRCDRCRKLTVTEAKLLRRANCLAADRRAA